MSHSNQPKPFALPLQLVTALEAFAPADRGEAYSLILNYIYYRREPAQDCSPAARGAFELAMIILAPELEKREEAELSAIQKNREQVTQVNIQPVEPLRPLFSQEDRKALVFKLVNLHKTPKMIDAAQIIKEYSPREKLSKRLIKNEFTRRNPDDNFDEFYLKVKDLNIRSRC